MVSEQHHILWLKVQQQSGRALGVQPHSSTTTVCTWSGFLTFSSHSLSSLDVLAIVQSII